MKIRSLTPGSSLANRSLSKLLPAALLAVASLLAAPANSGAETNSLPLHFQGRDGSPHTLAELRGAPAVINFWATWCGPCREEMPLLQKLSETYTAQGVRFVAISLDAPDTQDKIDAAIQKRGFRIPVWTGATDHTLTDLQLGVLVPATLILDADGTVIGKIEGQASAKDLRSRLDWVLNGRQGRQPKIVQKNDW